MYVLTYLSYISIQFKDVSVIIFSSRRMLELKFASSRSLSQTQQTLEQLLHFVAKFKVQSMMDCICYHPYLLSRLFGVLLCLHYFTISMFCNTCLCHFLSSTCMLELIKICHLSHSSIVHVSPICSSLRASRSTSCQRLPHQPRTNLAPSCQSKWNHYPVHG